MTPDSTAIARHRAFGAEIAADHFRKFRKPGSGLTVCSP